MSQKVIAVIGASGYVGMHFIRHHLQHSSDTIIAISRSHPFLKDHFFSPFLENGKLEFRKCDVYHRKDLFRALQGADVAIYLIHSMLPTARLDQGEFQDFDLILADNFKEACEVSQVRKVVFVGGLLPSDCSDLSLHLSSRLEVEEYLGAGAFQFLSFRAGIIIGQGGSSFSLMYLLVTRLFFLICPKWTLTQTTPVDISDMIICLSDAISNERSGVYDLAGPTTLSYLDMMKELARHLNLKRFFLPVPYFSPQLSRLWVSLITGAPKNLVKPLVSSLTHEMVANRDRLYKIPQYQFLPFQQSLTKALKDLRQEVRAFSSRKFSENEVRSLQRFRLKKKVSARWIAQLYFKWLPRFMFPFIRVISVENQSLKFCLFFHFIVLLQLKRDMEQSQDHLEVLKISGGLLVSQKNQGWLEFRRLSDQKTYMAAIHHFTPSLPWYIYRLTQAAIHGWVMQAFGAYLKRKIDHE